MKLCTVCDKPFHYPPSDNKADAKMCAWCAAIPTVEEDKNLVSEASDCSQIVIPKDITLKAEQTAARIANVLGTQYPAIDWPFRTISNLIADALLSLTRPLDASGYVRPLWTGVDDDLQEKDTGSGAIYDAESGEFLFRVPPQYRVMIVKAVNAYHSQHQEGTK